MAEAVETAKKWLENLRRHYPHAQFFPKVYKVEKTMVEFCGSP